ncbi:MAG: Double zinc ribbon, partial [Acidimicrobiales bacterium]|nr:Double zinc ribbon [Acidimicrobiales bacterium]
MSETTTCPACNTALPAGAAFCTSCGTRLGTEGATAPAAAAPPPPPGPDVTRVDTPGLHDATQVQPVVEEPPPGAPPGPSEPAWEAPPPAWQP